MIGPAVTDARRRKVEEELREVQNRITKVIEKQELYKKGIDHYEQQCHESSQEQEEGELSALLVPIMWTHVHKIVLLY